MVCSDYENIFVNHIVLWADVSRPERDSGGVTARGTQQVFNSGPSFPWFMPLVLILILRYDDTINGKSVIQRPQLVCSCARTHAPALSLRLWTSDFNLAVLNGLLEKKELDFIFPL